MTAAPASPRAARNFLFDFDGTLADSAPLHAGAFRAALAIEAPAALAGFDYEPLKGLSTREAFERLGVAGTERLLRCVARKRAAYRDAVRAGRLRAFRGARELLAALRRAGARSYLVTSGSSASVALALERLDLAGAFAGIVAGDDAARGKPAPDPYLECIRRYALDAAGSVAVEDAPSGVESARAASLRVIGVHNPAVAPLVDRYFPTLELLAAAIEDERGRQAPASGPRYS
jgi:HAD superfamily hydrolase (TIGR01509 family)